MRTQALEGPSSSRLREKRFREALVVGNAEKDRELCDQQKKKLMRKTALLHVHESGLQWETLRPAGSGARA